MALFVYLKKYRSTHSRSYISMGINHTAKYSGCIYMDMYIVNSVHFDECCQYALLKFEWILTQIPDKCYNDMSQPRSVGLRDPTRSVNSIYGMKYQIRNKRRSNFAWRKGLKLFSRWQLYETFRSFQRIIQYFLH